MRISYIAIVVTFVYLVNVDVAVQDRASIYPGI